MSARAGRQGPSSEEASANEVPRRQALPWRSSWVPGERCLTVSCKAALSGDHGSQLSLPVCAHQRIPGSSRFLGPT